jgi:hypothetical protein
MNREFLSEVERLQLELADSKRKEMTANAEKALAQNELSDAQYKNVVLQLFLKYKLGTEDHITKEGEIMRKPTEDHASKEVELMKKANVDNPSVVITESGEES